MRRTIILVAIVAIVVAVAGTALAGEPDTAAQLKQLQQANESLNHRLDQLAKGIDDVLWFDRVGDVAVVDKIRIYGPPRANVPNPDAIGATNHLKFYAYVFTPREDFGGAKLPLLLLPHGGVHGDFTTYYAHIVRELVAQGYVVVAPEYRGSTGYGEGMYKDIDYGGREVGDVLAARDWAVANHPRVDPERVGLIGWSHGGLITLMSLMDHPDKYVCGFAGVPVSDLVMRMGYWGPDYQKYYDAPYHIGQTPAENLEAYKGRSPVWNVDKLKRPVRIHTNVHDEDVNYIEVQHLIQALKAAGKKFEYEVSDVPGGHSFDRLDTAEAWGYRKKAYAFLARYLKPPRPDIELGVSEEGVAAP